MDFTQFDITFGPLNPFPYTRSAIQSIESSRRSLGGSLFIDKVLKVLNLAKSSSYPPKNANALGQLHQVICASESITLHHKLSILYYLLLDVDSRSGNGNLAGQFAKLSGIPDHYLIFMKGLWMMDMQNFEIALQYLTHPSLISDFADDIIHALVRHAEEDGDYTLALAYYHTVQPSIQSPASFELLFDAIARSSVTEAYEFTRSHADYMRRQLFRRMVLTVLDCGRSEEDAQRAFELTSLPFDADEEKWFMECLESGEGKRLKAAKDTLLMRRIATGQAIVGSEKGTWATVLEGFKVGSGGRPQA